jgi:hypothetical protein
MLDEEMSAEAGDEIPDDGSPPRPAKKANDLGWG